MKTADGVEIKVGMLLWHPRYDKQFLVSGTHRAGGFDNVSGIFAEYCEYQQGCRFIANELYATRGARFCEARSVFICNNIIIQEEKIEKLRYEQASVQEELAELNCIRLEEDVLKAANDPQEKK